MGDIIIHSRSDGKETPSENLHVEPNFIPAKCAKSKEGLLIRLTRDEKGWCLESTFKDGTTQGETYSYNTNNTVFDAFQRTSDGFNCAGCGAKRFAQCHLCAKFTCWSGEGFWICAYCGASGYPSGTIKSVDIVSDKKKK